MEHIDMRVEVTEEYYTHNKCQMTIKQWRHPKIVLYTLDQHTPMFVAAKIATLKHAHKLTLGYLMEILSGYFLLGPRLPKVVDAEHTRSIMAYDGERFVKKSTDWLLYEFLASVKGIYFETDQLRFQGVAVERVFLMYGQEYQSKSMENARNQRLMLEKRIQEISKTMEERRTLDPKKPRLAADGKEIVDDDLLQDFWTGLTTNKEITDSNIPLPYISTFDPQNIKETSSNRNNIKRQRVSKNRLKKQCAAQQKKQQQAIISQ